MTRIHISGTLQVGSELSLPDAQAHHVAQVLRLRSGAELCLFNGEGGEYEAEIVACERRRVDVRVLRFVEIDRESKLGLSLAQCVSKGERMDYTLQKAVELGVAAIVPLLSARSVVKLDAERWDKKLAHWRGVIGSACEQSGRTRVPPLAGIARLDSWLDTWLETPIEGARLVLVPAAVSLNRVSPASQATLLVGPEGGLSEAEVAQAIRCGFTPVGLGPRVLRTETAGVAALAALQALWGDLT